jgi:glycosyltransferase involved in cell wall biosynthesis
MRLREWRQRLATGYGLPAVWLFEEREVRRLRRELAGALPRARVACIIPTYRRPAGLLAAIQSILAQEMQDFIIVVVDDGGGLPQLPADRRLAAVSLSRNIGIAGIVRNVGIRLSNSDCVAFLDDDNTWSPRHLAVCLEAIGQGADVAYTSVRRETPLGDLVDIVSRTFDRRSLARRSYIDTSSIVSIRDKDLLFSRLPRDERSKTGEDWELMFRFSRNREVVHVPIPTVNYLINPESYFHDW